MSVICNFEIDTISWIFIDFLLPAKLSPFLPLFAVFLVDLTMDIDLSPIPFSQPTWNIQRTIISKEEKSKWPTIVKAVSRT
jgi:hypothetical protein